MSNRAQDPPITTYLVIPCVRMGNEFSVDMHHEFMLFAQLHANALFDFSRSNDEKQPRSRPGASTGLFYQACGRPCLRSSR